MINKALAGAIGGGIAIVIAAVVVFTPLVFSPPKIPGEDGGTGMRDVTITLTSVNIKQMDDQSVTIEVAFDVLNPNKNTLVLEQIDYDLAANGVKLTRSFIGERLEGMVTSTGQTYYVVPGLPLTLRDTVEIVKVERLTDVWYGLQDPDVDWRVTGNFVITDPVRGGGKDVPFDFSR